MNERQILIGNKILSLFKDNENILHDAHVLGKLGNENFSYNESKSVFYIMIDDYHLFNRNIVSPESKQITEKGLKAQKIGLKKFLRQRKFENFIEKHWFKVFVFLIGTAIAIANILLKK